MVEKLCKVLETNTPVTNLKHTPQSAQNSFSRKSSLMFCNIFNMISFANAQGSAKIKLASSRVLLLIISSPNIFTQILGKFPPGEFPPANSRRSNSPW